MSTPADYGWRRVGLTWTMDRARDDEEPDGAEHLRPVEEGEEGPKKATSGAKPKSTCARCPQQIDSRATHCRDCHDFIVGETPKPVEKPAEEEKVPGIRAQQDAERARTHEDRLWETLARTAPIRLAVDRATCEGCGCLLIHAAELCPACVIPWMRATARDAAYRSFQPEITTTENPREYRSMSRERIDFPMDRDKALRLYDELGEVGCTDPELAARRIGIPLEDLERYLKSRLEVQSRKTRGKRSA